MNATGLTEPGGSGEGMRRATGRDREGWFGVLDSWGAGVRPDGTFTVGASKTVAVPVEQLFAAFVDADLRELWLPGARIRERTSQPGRSARFDWDDGATRVNVSVAATGEDRSQAAVEHERLPDARTAEETKAYWRERLEVLKAVLEAGPPRPGGGDE